MQLKVTVVGLGECQKALREFEPKVQKRLVRTGMKKSLKPVLETARSLAPQRTGILRASLQIRAIKRSRLRFGYKVVTSRYNFRGAGAFYGGMQEFGWTTKGGNKVAGKHFLEQAYDQQGDHVKDNLIAEIWEAIEVVASESRL